VFSFQDKDLWTAEESVMFITFFWYGRVVPAITLSTLTSWSRSDLCCHVAPLVLPTHQAACRCLLPPLPRELSIAGACISRPSPFVLEACPAYESCSRICHLLVHLLVHRLLHGTYDGFLWAVSYLRLQVRRQYTVCFSHVCFSNSCVLVSMRIHLATFLLKTFLYLRLDLTGESLFSGTPS
jgi:hypothetical protein